MVIRTARAEDADALAQIYYDAVRIGAAPAYSQAQRAGWATHRPSAANWANRLDGLLTLVAGQDGLLTGFMSMRMSDGYLDLAFVTPDARRTGVAVALYDAIETRARAAKLSRVFSHASSMAKPFFERSGWRVIKAQQVDRGGITLDNWLMEKSLC